MKPEGSISERASAQKLASKKRAGFTLLELLVVLTIIGFLSLLIVPRLGSLGLAQLRSEARRLRAVIQAGYELSVVEKRGYRLALDLDEQCYWLEVQSEADYQPAENQLFSKHCLPESLSIREFEAPGRKLSGSGRDYIYFSPFGYVEPGRIYLADNSGNGFTLFTVPATGQVEILEGRWDFKDYEEREK